MACHFFFPSCTCILYVSVAFIVLGAHVGARVLIEIPAAIRPVLYRSYLVVRIAHTYIPTASHKCDPKLEQTSTCIILIEKKE